MVCIHPTVLFAILEPRDQGIGEFYETHQRRATGFKAPKMSNGSLGAAPFSKYKMNPWFLYLTGPYSPRKKERTHDALNTCSNDHILPFT